MEYNSNNDTENLFNPDNNYSPTPSNCHSELETANLSLSDFPDDLLNIKRAKSDLDPAQNDIEENFSEIIHNPIVSTLDSSDSESNLSMKEPYNSKEAKHSQSTKHEKFEDKRDDEICRIFITIMINKIETRISDPLKEYYRPLKKDPKMKFSTPKLKKKIVKKELLSLLSKLPIRDILTNSKYTPESEENKAIISELEKSNSPEAAACLLVLSSTFQNCFRQFLHDEGFYTNKLEGQFNLRMIVVNYYAKKIDLSKDPKN